jgi:hypothetical protein
VEVEEAILATKVVRAVKFEPIEGIKAKVVALRFGFEAEVVLGGVVVAVTKPLFWLFWTITVVNLGEASVNNTVICGEYDICVINSADAVGPLGSDGVGEGAASGTEVGGRISEIDGGAIRNGVAACVIPALVPSEEGGEGNGAFVVSWSVVSGLM